MVRRLHTLGRDDGALVGGKNASLGEMIRALGTRGVRVPEGYATTAEAYRLFVAHNDLVPTLREQLARLGDAEDGDRTLRDVGQTIRSAIEAGELPAELVSALREAHAELADAYGDDELDVAARSSATAEDLPEASFAGQLESFLNLRGEEAVLDAVRRCYASLFTDRAIRYRQRNGFDHLQVALSVGIQKMVRAGERGEAEGAAGVMFTLDTQTGFPEVVVIDANWGLGETVVSGSANPDEYRVYKPLLRDGLRPILGKTRGTKQRKLLYAEGDGRTDGATTEEVETSEAERSRFVLGDEEILTLARWGAAIEAHYGRAMDIEWARDARDGELYVVQARPETVQSRKRAGTLRTYRLKEEGHRLLEGVAIGDAIAAGKAFVLSDPSEGDRFEEGGVLVTSMTSPDWGPLLERAGAIVTDQGGRTSHAAIVSRELGVPAVIGTGHATETLKNAAEVTVDCSQGQTGLVYEGALPFETRAIDLSELPTTRTPIMMILASPNAAFRWWSLPVAGVGLARMEFVINNVIQIHPLALVHFETLEDEEAKRRIEALTRGYDDKKAYFVDHLARGIASIAAVARPHPAIVRLSDFKTNEYRDLVGGRAFEPEEANPMLGHRGASRYISERYREAFGLECRAVRMAREEMGFDNVVVMVPFCRTVGEADAVLEAMAEHGLVRGRKGLQVYVMAEIPSNVILAEQFAARFDGFSIGTNDLTQLVLGVDRDNEQLAHLLDARDEAVRRMIEELIEKAHQHGTPVGICGQAPSDHPDFGAFLVRTGIDSISVNPDSVAEIIEHVAAAERG